MLWRHRNAHIMYAFTLDCRPGAVQKRAQFRALRKVNEDIDYFVGSRRFRAVGVRSQGGKGPPVSTSCRSKRPQYYLSLPRFWCRMILRRYLRSLGDCGRYLKVQPRTFGCFSVRITSFTCPHRPGSSPFDEMVNYFANLAQCPKLGCFLHRAGATIKGKCVHYMRVPMPPVHPAGPGRCLVEWVPRERTVYVGKRSNSSRVP